MVITPWSAELCLPPNAAYSVPDLGDSGDPLHDILRELIFCLGDQSADSQKVSYTFHALRSGVMHRVDQVTVPGFANDNHVLSGIAA